MVDVSELRIGNLVLLSVNWKDNIHRIDEIRADEVAVTSIEDGGYFPRMVMSSCSPIPLTPEWLERCGFKNEDGSTLWDNGIIAIFDYNENNVYSFHYQSKKSQVQYLHQLQNLYFALTGGELEIKY